MMSTSTDELRLKKLANPKHAEARKADKFKDDELDTELVSVGQMDRGSNLASLFHNGKVKVIDPIDKEINIPGEILLEGELKPNGLRMANLSDDDDDDDAPTDMAPKKPKHRTFDVDDCPYPRFKNVGSRPDEHAWHRANLLQHQASALAIRTVPALIDYCHMCLGAPPIRSWLAAIDKGWFASWPELTAERVRKHCSDKPQATHGPPAPRSAHLPLPPSLPRLDFSRFLGISSQFHLQMM